MFTKLGPFHLLILVNLLIHIGESSTVFAQEPLSVEISWSKVQGAKSYKLQVSKDKTLKKFIIDKNVEALKINLPISSPGSYFWRVAAVDEYGETGIFSKTNKVIVRAKKVEQIKPTTKKNSITIKEGFDLNKTFKQKITWKTTSKLIKNFKIIYSETKSFDSPKIDIIEESEYSFHIRAGQTIYWKVIPLDNEGKELIEYTLTDELNLDLNISFDVPIISYAERDYQIIWKKSSIAKFYELEFSSSNKDFIKKIQTTSSPFKLTKEMFQGNESITIKLRSTLYDNLSPWSNEVKIKNPWWLDKNKKYFVQIGLGQLAMNIKQSPESSNLSIADGDLAVSTNEYVFTALSYFIPKDNSPFDFELNTSFAYAQNDEEQFTSEVYSGYTLDSTYMKIDFSFDLSYQYHGWTLYAGAGVQGYNFLEIQIENSNYSDNVTFLTEVFEQVKIKYQLYAPYEVSPYLVFRLGQNLNDFNNEFSTNLIAGIRSKIYQNYYGDFNFQRNSTSLPIGIGNGNDTINDFQIIQFSLARVF